MATVLVVEDELLIRLHVADCLRDDGFEVLEAADGAAAIAILSSGAAVDAVFTDVTLPGEPDGFALTHWIRENRPGLPIALTSGEIAPTPALLARRDQPFFPKPCDYAQVASTIRRLLGAGG